MLPLLVATAALASTPPNLLLIVVDDVGVDKISGYAADAPGYGTEARFLPQTGSIDDLARAGLRFTDAWANPTCSPTRSAIHTGRHGFRTGVGMPVPLGPAPDPASETMLAEVLAQRGVGDADGYATGHFGKWHLGDEGARGTTDWTVGSGTSREVRDSASPLRFGFQFFDGALWGQIEDYHAWTRVISDGSGRSTVQTERRYATDVVAQSAVEWIRKQRAPWFASVAFHAGHTSGNVRSMQPGDLDPGCPPLRAARTGDDADLATYQSVVECLDTRIGEMLRGIPAQTMANTVVVFIGDNGTEDFLIEGRFADRGTRRENGKTTTYETGIHVPFIVTDGANWLQWVACPPAQRAAGACTLTPTHIRAPGRTVAAPVHAVDLFATFAELAGTKSPTGVDSTSLVSCLQDATGACAARAKLPAYAEMFQYGGQGGLSQGKAALRQGDDKLVVRYSRVGCLTYELYDLGADPLEGQDRAGTDPSTLSTLRRALDGLSVPWMSGIRECAPGEGASGGRPGGGRPGGGGPGGGGPGSGGGGRPPGGGNLPPRR